jgi:hypothetical protein
MDENIPSNYLFCFTEAVWVASRVRTKSMGYTNVEAVIPDIAPVIKFFYVSEYFMFRREDSLEKYIL